MYRKIWGKMHPECGEDEFYIGNCSPRDFERDFADYSSRRMGEVPYHTNGSPMLNPPPYLKPLFFSKADYERFLCLAKEEAGPRIQAVEIFTKPKGGKHDSDS